jgi:hypothetical protein
MQSFVLVMHRIPVLFLPDIRLIQKPDTIFLAKYEIKLPVGTGI